MGKDVGFGSARVSQGCNDLPLLDDFADVKIVFRDGMTVDRTQPVVVKVVKQMFYDHRFSKKILDNPNNRAVIYYGDLCRFAQTKNSVISILVKTYIQSLMGLVALALISPPFVR